MSIDYQREKLNFEGAGVGAGGLLLFIPLFALKIK